MKIDNLNGQYAKISKASITVKSDDGKTEGIITKCYELSDRECSDLWGRVRKAVGIDATKCLRKMRKASGIVVYLENINIPDENARKLETAGFMVAKYRKLA